MRSTPLNTDNTERDCRSWSNVFCVQFLWPERVRDEVWCGYGARHRGRPPAWIIPARFRSAQIITRPFAVLAIAPSFEQNDPPVTTLPRTRAFDVVGGAQHGVGVPCLVAPMLVVVSDAAMAFGSEIVVALVLVDGADVVPWSDEGDSVVRACADPDAMVVGLRSDRVAGSLFSAL